MHLGQTSVVEIEIALLTAARGPGLTITVYHRPYVVIKIWAALLLCRLFSLTTVTAVLIRTGMISATVPKQPPSYF